MKRYDGCPLCKSTQIFAFLDGTLKNPREGLPETITWMSCRDCNHVFTENYWEESDFDTVLKYEQEHQALGGHVDEQRKEGLEICRIMAQKVPAGTWIDLGSGNGVTVFSASEYGYDAIGVDLRPLPVKGLQSFGYSAFQGNCLDLDYTGIDIVSMGDLLEHLPYPKEFLEKLYAEGVRGVYISCPNMDTITWRWLDKKNENPYWVELEHHHNFTKTRLEKLLKEVGFTPFYYGCKTRYISNMEIFASK